MKKLIALLLALVMVLGLVACAAEEAPAETPADAPAAAPDAPAEEPAEEPEAPAEEPEAPAEEEPEDVTLVCWAYDDHLRGAYEAFGEEVEAKFPWITIEWEFLPYDSGPEKFTVACATGTTPDLYFDGYSRIAPAVDAGLCIDVTDIVSANADIFLAAPNNGIVDGKNYYIPIGANTGYGLNVNMGLARELGVADMLPEDTLTWSYDEFLAFCRAAKEANPAIYPIGLFAGSQSSDAWYYSWLLGNNSKVCNEDCSATAFNSDEYREASLEVLNVFKTLIDEELTPPGIATMTDQEVEQFFFSGQTLISHGGIASYSYYDSLMQDGTIPEMEIQAYGVPTSDGDHIPNCAQWGTSGIVGFNNNGNEETIKMVLDFFLDTESKAYQLLLDAGCTTYFTEAKGTVAYRTEEIADKMNFGIEYSVGYAIADFGIEQPWWTEFRQGLYPQLQDFYAGNIDAQTVLDNWQAFGDNVINTANAG